MLLSSFLSWPCLISSCTLWPILSLLDRRVIWGTHFSKKVKSKYFWTFLLYNQSKSPKLMNIVKDSNSQSSPRHMFETRSSESSTYKYFTLPDPPCPNGPNQHRGLDHPWKGSWFFCVKSSSNWKRPNWGNIQCYVEIYSKASTKTKMTNTNTNPNTKTQEVQIERRKVPMWNRKGPIEATDMSVVLRRLARGSGTAAGHSPHQPGPDTLLYFCLSFSTTLPLKTCLPSFSTLGREWKEYFSTKAFDPLYRHIWHVYWGKL